MSQGAPRTFWITRKHLSSWRTKALRAFPRALPREHHDRLLPSFLPSLFRPPNVQWQRRDPGKQRMVERGGSRQQVLLKQHHGASLCEDICEPRGFRLTHTPAPAVLWALFPVPPVTEIDTNPCPHGAQALLQKIDRPPIKYVQCILIEW